MQPSQIVLWQAANNGNDLAASPLAEPGSAEAGAALDGLTG